jgi:hypothetical protein
MKMRAIRCIATLAIIAAPGGVAFLLDRELLSPIHLPIMGIAGLCISLCDALYGQIISNTKWIPFSACHTPAEAQKLVRLFKTYHRSMIVEWLIAKVTSAVVVMMTTAMAFQKGPDILVQHRLCVLMVGYVLLGVSISLAISFVFSYFSASDAFDRARLEEMNYAYRKDHPDIFLDSSAIVKKQLEGFAPGFTSSPTTAATIQKTRDNGSA